MGGLLKALALAGVAIVAALSSSVDAQRAPPVAATGLTPQDIFAPRLMAWGFDNRDPMLELAGYRVRVQVATAENTYGMDAATTTVRRVGDSWIATSKGLAWAGQQEKSPGSVTVTARRTSPNRVEFLAQATSDKPLRVVKLIIEGIAGDKSGSAMWKETNDIRPGGVLYHYPEYFHAMPAWFVADAAGKNVTTFGSADLELRGKWFAAYPDDAGRPTKTIELIFEEKGTKWRNTIAAPTWIVTTNSSQQAVIDERLKLLEDKAGLRRWEQRTDVPTWARDIKLVMTMHLEHWGGYIFNDYAKTLRTFNHAADRMPGKNIMVFLAGWEGRYYWQYGEYRPEPRLGGAVEFKKMIDGIHARGGKVMMMFGGNSVNGTFPNYAKFGPQSRLVSATGQLYQGNNPDWDITRTRDTGWQIWLNPGSPVFQNKLYNDISSMHAKYGFDGVYLDTQPDPYNNGNFDQLEGLRQLTTRLRQGRPQLLLSGETYFDLSLPFMPWSETPGGYRNWSSRYQRRMGFLGVGEPARGSSGTHEQGYFPYDEKAFRKIYDVPTIAFVDTTLADAPEKVDALIDAAAKYDGGAGRRDED